jgi:hypothetical protein
MDQAKIIKAEFVMAQLSKEQVEIIKFCTENWEKIKRFRDKGLFEPGVVLASVQANYKPTGEVQNKHFHFVDNNKEDVAFI